MELLGRLIAIFGSTISLVALGCYVFIQIAVTVTATLSDKYSSAIFWLMLSLAGTLISVIALVILLKTGSKTVVATAGIIMGIIAVMLSAMLIMDISNMQSASDERGDKMREQLKKADEHVKTDMNRANDSLPQHAANY